MPILVSPKVRVAFLIAFLAVAVIGAAMYRSTVLFEDVNDSRQRSLDAIADVRRVLVLTLNAETSARGYALIGSDLFLEPYRAADAGLRDAVVRLRAAAGAALPDGEAKRLEELAGERLAWSRRQIDLRRDYGLTAAANLVASGRGKAITDEVRGIVAAVEARETRRLDTLDREWATRATTVRVVVVIASLLTLLILLSAAVLIQREERGRREADDALRAAHATLEQQVEERTADLRRTNESLRRSERQLRTAQRLSKIGSWVWDMQADALTWSEEMYEIFGRSPADGPVAYQDLPILFTPESMERVDAAIQHAGGSEEPFEIELEAIHADGSPRHLVSRGNSVRDSDGHVSRLEGTMQDVSERVESETRSLQAQKMEAVGRLAGGIAHDFNNILMVINGYSNMLLAHPAAPELLAEALAEIRSAGEKGAALTRQMLTFSRNQVIEPRVLDLNSVVHDVEGLLRRAVGEDIDLAIRLEPELSAVLADPSQMSQVLLNLVVNAREAMPSGGRLTIETANVPLAEAYARRRPQVSPGKYVRLTVSDSGVGMNADTLSRMFEPFFTTKHAGTGFGLATVHTIVTQAKGSIETYSEPGKGTTFKIYLPAHESDGAPDRHPAPPAVARPGSETILLVEDQVDVRRLLRAALHKYGYTVLEAANAREALRKAQEYSRPIHLLLTDVVMPHMSGKELADRLAPSRPGMEILFMSGYTEHAIDHQGILDRGVEFIQKPAAPNELALKIRELLDRRQSSGAVLVVDDEEAVRHLLQRLLESGGYRVVTAADGKDAEKKAAAEDFDVAIVDIVMPGQEGIETIQSLLRKRPALKVVAISGAAYRHQYLESARKLGANVILPKPIAPDEFLRIIRQLSPG
jgi:PAS domain S-box-containing protein